MTKAVPGAPAERRTPRQPLPAPWRRRVDSVLSLPAEQQPEWPDPARAEEVGRELGTLPPLTLPAEVDLLRGRLAQVAAGDAFLVQGGDCAETFADTTEPGVRAGIETLERMADALARRGGLPVLTVARLAGQYAKPRSSPTDALGLPAYRGDIVNSARPAPRARRPDPRRMLRAYAYAAGTLNVVRALRAGASGRHGGNWGPFVSHEALLLPYERGLARLDESSGTPKLYGLSGHFLWIGERTRRLDGAHVAFAELLANPIGIKIGPGAAPGQVVEYAERLNPGNEPGRVTLISRMGDEKVRDVLPAMVEAVRKSGQRVVWQCDPMHGNTYESAAGYKTRHFDRIVNEMQGFFEVHHALGSHPGGLHIEFSGSDVTECVGGARGISDAEIGGRYETACDPRLNSRQAVELAALAGRALAARPGSAAGAR
ncbi:3-deoxy-7-phosphoheptulonate synthase [Streptomyces boncukensis]|uniref:3-deoxy-7-phosphoheptulonate synthase n=1 Tax=Streptomyces boncukensis TaxID=2711219 RepID=UPI003B976159